MRRHSLTKYTAFRYGFHTIEKQIRCNWIILQWLTGSINLISLTDQSRTSKLLKSGGAKLNDLLSDSEGRPNSEDEHGLIIESRLANGKASRLVNGPAGWHITAVSWNPIHRPEDRNWKRYSHDCSYKHDPLFIRICIKENRLQFDINIWFCRVRFSALNIINTINDPGLMKNGEVCWP